VVIKGRGIGKSLEYPTANIHIDSDLKLIPKNGVYIVKSSDNEKLLWGMMNIGVNPTFNNSKLSLEVHFLDYNNSLYDKTLTIQLVKFLRDEQKFSSVEALKAQIKMDEKQTRDFIKIHD
jgi:riboflavin kinase/FMN adenylyltransferase